MDPKTFSSKVFDGGKGEKEGFEEWRDDLEDQLETYFPGIKSILTVAARATVEITESNFEDLVRTAGVDPHALTWTHRTVNDENVS